MKIAQIAPLIESVPPKFYGGTERVVSYLTEELTQLGHEVTLFASGDSSTSARLVPCCKQALRLSRAVKDPIPYYMHMLDVVHRMASEFDVLHFHIDQFHFPLFRPLASKTLTTLHGRQDLPDLRYLYSEFPEMKLVSISNSQRADIPDGHFLATIPHGLPSDLLPPKYHPRGGYLAFLGRLSREKRVDRAIEIARCVGLPLRIAAKIDPVDEAYVSGELSALLTQPGVNYIGEIDEHQKAEFLGNASALVFPIDWPEPFGLVMIEAMACGTPVLAFRSGSVPEIVEPGVSGYIVDSIGEAVCKMGDLLSLNRQKVRQQFELRFTAERMAKDYTGVYRAMISPSRRPEGPFNAAEAREPSPAPRH